MDRSGSLSLADGRVVTLRSAAPEDAGRVQAFVGGLSLAARRDRWFAPVRELPPRELQRITAPRGHKDWSLVALADSGEVVGLAEYVQDAGGDAEFAVVVADDWRRIGFGTILVRRLIRDAARAGLNSLRALVLHDNPAMLGLAGQIGFARRRDSDPALVRIEMGLKWNEALTG